MSRPQKILVDFSKYTPSNLVTQGQTNADSLTNNPDIPTPTPTVAILQAAVDDLRSAIAAAKTGGKQQRQIRDQKFDELIVLLKQEATYVSMIANGDVAIMLGAGFEVSKIPSPIGPLPKPVKFVVSSPRIDALQLSLERIKGAKYYQFEYKKAGDTQWKVSSSQKTKIVIEGLESAQAYVARILPLGTSEEKTYSDEITAVVI